MKNTKTLILEDENYKTVIDKDGFFEVFHKHSDYTSDGEFYIDYNGNVYCEDYNIDAGEVLITGEDADNIKRFLED